MKHYENEIRLIIADIDGTLLTSQKTMLPSTEEAVREIINGKKCAFTLCTGRPFIFTEPIAEYLNLKIPFSFSGGSVFDPLMEKLISAPIINTLQIDKIISIAEKYKIGLLAHTSGNLFCMVNDRDWESLSSFEWIKGRRTDPPKRIKDIRTDFPHEIIRLDLFAEVNWLSKVSEEIQNEVAGVDVIEMKRSIEISEAGIDKGAALRRIAELLNIPVENTMGIGDSLNDESLIQSAGFGVAMATAPQGLKNVADAVVPSSDDDGFVKALELID